MLPLFSSRSTAAASQEVAELGIESVVGRPLLYQAHASTLAPSLQGKGECLLAPPRAPQACACMQSMTQPQLAFQWACWAYASCSLHVGRHASARAAPRSPSTTLERFPDLIRRPSLPPSACKQTRCRATAPSPSPPACATTPSAPPSSTWVRPALLPRGMAVCQTHKSSAAADSCAASLHSASGCCLLQARVGAAVAQSAPG